MNLSLTEANNALLVADTPENGNAYPLEPNGLPDKFPFKNRKSHAKRSTVLTQLVQLQDAAFAIAKDPNVKETVRCFAMRSYCSLQEERRKLQMRPLPKPVDVSKDKRGRRQAGPSAPAYQEPDATTGSVQPKPEKPQSPK